MFASKSPLTRIILVFLCTWAFSQAAMHQGQRIYEDGPKKLAYPDFPQLLQQHGLERGATNEQVNRDLESESLLKRLLRGGSRFSGKGPLSTDRYYSHEQINNYIEDLSARYPHRVQVDTVGHSYEGREMKTITITNGDDYEKDVILIDGGIHAREWISPATVLYVIHQLVENYQENAELLQKADWVILPVLNPDGYEYSRKSDRYWRKNRRPTKNTGCVGTDLNRNFGYHWGDEESGSFSSDPCDYQNYNGPNAFSEPETVAMRDLMHSVKHRGLMYLSLHSFAGEILFPWTWKKIQPDNVEDLYEVAEAGSIAMWTATGTDYSVRLGADLYIAAGVSIDYAFDLGFPLAYTIELTGTNGFEEPEENIDHIAREMWIGVRAMALKAMEM